MKNIAFYIFTLILVMNFSCIPQTSTDDPLVFFEKSSINCRPEYHRLNLCDINNPYAYCITIKKNNLQINLDLWCHIKGTASFYEKITNMTKTVTDNITFTMNKKENEKVICYDFSKDLYNLWIFNEFTSFSGLCSNHEEGLNCNEDCLHQTFSINKTECRPKWDC